MYEKYILTQQLKKFLKRIAMNSTESRIGLLLEDAQTALERGVKRGAVKMDIQLEIRCGAIFIIFFFFCIWAIRVIQG